MNFMESNMYDVMQELTGVSLMRLIHTEDYVLICPNYAVISPFNMILAESEGIRLFGNSNLYLSRYKNVLSKPFKMKPLLLDASEEVVYTFDSGFICLASEDGDGTIGARFRTSNNFKYPQLDDYKVAVSDKQGVEVGYDGRTGDTVISAVGGVVCVDAKYEGGLCEVNLSNTVCTVNKGSVVYWTGNLFISTFENMVEFSGTGCVRFIPYGDFMADNV